MRINWARTSRFNWLWDNMGGCPVNEVACGALSGATTTVNAQGKVVIQTPLPGGGKVRYVWGVWKTTAIFYSHYFWTLPESGDLTNYYTGGSYENAGTVTTITLGTGLAAGTAVQIYYFYELTTPAVKYDAMNNLPAPRQAYRSATDYSYDYAPDRLLDLMCILDMAGQVRSQDYSPHYQFLWNKFYAFSPSLTSPLLNDTFERSLWDRGPYSIYRDSTLTLAGFSTFDILLYPGDSANPPSSLVNPRALQVTLPAYSNPYFAAWWGYGLNWNLDFTPFNTVDKVNLKLRSACNPCSILNLCRGGFAGGNATLIVQDRGGATSSARFAIVIDGGGAIGTATFKWSLDGGATWEAEGLTTGDFDHPSHLQDNIYIWWHSNGGTDLAVGDAWAFTSLEVYTHPQRLLLILNDTAINAANPWTAEHTFVHALPDRYDTLTALEIPFTQFWRLDNLVFDNDRKRGSGWGTWYSASQQDTSDIVVSEREVTATIEGNTYYSQLQVQVIPSEYLTAWGIWTGLNTATTDSTGKTGINLAIFPDFTGATFTMRLKVKDANGSYFYKDFTVTPNTWNRLSTSFASMSLESGSNPMVHPIQVVDIGCPQLAPGEATYYLTDVKFDDHIVFAGPNLRLLEFKYQESPVALGPPSYWLDDVQLNLAATDAYPYAPRLAISYGPLGPNLWRGPTLIHYAQPLAPHLVGEDTIATAYVQLHADAQTEFNDRYGGVKGPIVPVHTRNDIENVAYLGFEDFTRFTWWPKYRNYGLVSAAWHFNESLKDAINDYLLTWSSGNPTYGVGICQPGNTALTLNEAAHASLASNVNLEPGLNPFSLTLIIKGSTQAGNYKWFLDKIGADGWVIQSKTAGDTALQLKVTTSAGDTYSDIAGVLDDNWHMITWMVVPADSKIYKVKDGVLLGNDALSVGTGLLNSAALNIGTSGIFSLDYFKYERRVLPAAEYENTWNIVQGNLLGSVYPEIGYDLGQYWAFMKVAHYYFHSGNAAAWTYLDNWLTWLNTYGLDEGNGKWNFPHIFSEFGFKYGVAPFAYDPGATAAIAIGCLYIYMKNQDSRANTWARRILDDLRLNRQSAEYNYLYKTDSFHVWMQAMVAHAFGLAINGRPGSTYTFTSTADDRGHFEGMINQFLTMSGDSKPNVLNADLLPFARVEDSDDWSMAPNYMMNKESGSQEALVLMANVALDWAYYNQSGWFQEGWFQEGWFSSNPWFWFDALIDFYLLDNLTNVAEASIKSLALETDLTLAANLVRVIYGDFMRDKTFYKEAKDTALIAAAGEMPREIDLRYGNPIITESAAMAQLLASRALALWSKPAEKAVLEGWLELLRFELGDTVGVTSAFHGLSAEEFMCIGRLLDLDSKRVKLNLIRQIDWKT